jgi:tellurite resistance protein TerC
VIIMATFAVPREHQQRVLIFGIIAALALRAVFIALGAALLSLLSFMFVVFGLLLLWTAVRLYRHRDEDPDVGNNALVRASRRILPVSDTYDGGRLISRAGGRRVVTPLFIVFITIGGTDILFALDSIPAVFGVTDQPYIVFVANAFALLGLRALFFLVTGLLDRLVYLSSGLALILAFIGVKLILHWAHGLDPRVPEITTAISLTVIAVVLTVTTVASLIKSRRHPTARAHAGAVLGAPPRATSGKHRPSGPLTGPTGPARRPTTEQNHLGALVRSASRLVTCKYSAGATASAERPGRIHVP